MAVLKNICETGETVMNPKHTRFIRRAGGGIALPVAICLFLAALQLPTQASSLDSTALPAGGVITSGSGSISNRDTSMTVRQDSARMIVDWQSFNIGTDADVTFMQPNSSATALNRISDQSPSQVLGKLSANGRVFLVNPSGIIFGSSAQVNVGGLVATSLEIDNDDFMAGNYTFQSNGFAGEVNNAGNIEAQGGYVALIAPVMENCGSIVSNGSTVAMAAGNRVTLDLTGDGLLTYTIDQGAVEAQAVNHGLIRADGGLVYLNAEAANELTRAAVNNDGIIRAQTLKEVEGRIILMADMKTGTVNVGGTLDASAPDGGNGGFIETSAATVSVDNAVNLTTAAANGKSGTWLIDPYDFTIAPSGGDVTGATLTTALNSSDVTIETLADSVSCTGVSCGSGCNGNGNIYVNDTISWSSHTLTLDAYNNIEINSELTATGSAGLVLRYGQGATNGIINGTEADYAVNAPVNLESTCSFSTQLGTGGSPIASAIITDLSTLEAVGSSSADADSDGVVNINDNWVLGSNIDATASSFVPIGNNATRFTGSFDGLGHTVSNLTINSTSNFTGLFGFTHGATIRNIGIAGAGSITGTASHTGGLVGFLYYSTIINSYIMENVTGSAGTGGLVGRSEGSTITACYAAGAVTGGNSTGGLIGIANLDTITDSYASGVVQGTANVGGLVGISTDSSISDCYFTKDAGGSVSNIAVGGYTGGLVGVLKNDISVSTISNSYVTADVTGAYCTGGLVGHSKKSAISQCYATGDVEGTGTIGGFAGIVEDSVVSECYTIGDVTGNTVVGGFAGYLTAGSGAISSITNSYATGNVEGWRSVGGLVGLMGSRINDSDFLPDTILTGGSCTISNSYATGDVTGTTYIGYYVGGLVGYMGALILDDSDSNFEIKNTNCTITNSYATGDATGVDYVGGLVGYSGAYIGTYSDDATITDTCSTMKNSYAGGTVISTGSNAGDFVGYSGEAHDGTCLNYTLPANSSVVQDKEGNTVTDFTSFVLSAEQKNLNFYQTILGWGADIDADGGTGAIWRIYEGATFPFLRQFLTQADAADVTKVYDGTTSLGSAAISWSSGIDETLIYGTASSSGSEMNVGSYNNISLSGLYSSQQGYDILAGANLTITPALLTLTTSDVTRPYDGTTTAAGTVTISSGTLYGTDTLFGGTFAFTGADAGTGKTVTVSDVTINDGNSGNNYTVTYANNTYSTITPALLTITANDDSKYYDGIAYSGGNGVAYSGFVNGEGVNELLGTLAYSGTSQGATDAGSYVIEASGLTSGNYNIAFVDGSLTILPLATDSDTAGQLPGDAQKRQPPSGPADTTISNKINLDTLHDQKDFGTVLDVDTTIIGQEETTYLSTDSSFLVINFEYSPQGTVSLLCGGAATNELQGVIDAFPVFFDKQGNRSLIKNYEIHESHGTVSLKQLAQRQSSYEGISANDQDIRAQRSFNLTKGEDINQEFTIRVTDNGVVFISRSNGDTISHIDTDQIVLMTLKIIKQDMGINLNQIRGMVIVSGGVQNAAVLPCRHHVRNSIS